MTFKDGSTSTVAVGYFASTFVNTVVPTSTGYPCPAKAGGMVVLDGTGLLCHFSTFSYPGPIRSRTGLRPVLGPCLCSNSVFGPGRSDPVLDRFTLLMIRNFINTLAR